jgi:glutathione transport system permease protein
VTVTPRGQPGPELSSGYGPSLHTRLRPIGAFVLGTAAALLVASTFVFSLSSLYPGDPAETVLAREGRFPTPAAVEAKRAELGLDRPLLERYTDWLGGAVHGDLGRSWTTNASVSELIAGRVRATVLLAGVALALAVLVVIVAASVSALSQGRFIDEFGRVLAIAGIALPSFVLGLLVLQYLVLGVGIGKVIGDGTIGSVWLPASVLAFSLVCAWLRPLRALIVEALQSPAVLVARARGAGTLRVLAVHAVPNALVGFLPLVGLGVGSLIAGAVVVETVFSWPGLGQLSVDFAQRRDVPVIQAFTLFATAAYILASRGAALAAALLDPRLAIAERQGVV